MPGPVTAPIPRVWNMPVLKDFDLDSAAVSPKLSPVISPILGVISPISKMSPNLPFRLEELLDDCFQYSIDPKTLCKARAQHVQTFHQFLTERHTHENLSFVIEIFRYEYFFDKIHPENVEFQRSRTASQSQLSSSFLNQSLEHFIDSLPYPTAAMQRKVQKLGTPRSGSSLSLLSVQFGFEFDDIPPSSSEAWEVLKDQTISDDDESLQSSQNSNSPLDPDSLLTDQWDLIIREFIHENAPQQVNLSNKTAQEILDEDRIKGTSHNPIVLIKAKLEVMQLLEENAYSSFIRNQKAGIGNCECKTSCQPDTSVDSDAKKHNSNRTKHSTPHGRTELKDICMKSPLNKPAIASPLPQSKIRSKFLSHLSTNSEASSSGSSLSSFIQHLKTHSSNGSTRHAISLPHTASNSRAQSPVQEFDRPSSTVHDESPSILSKFWRKKK